MMTRGIACVFMTLLAAGAARGAVDCSVDFGAETGTFRRINGINGGPQTNGRAIDRNVSEFRDLHVASVRLHDMPLFNTGLRLVDVPMVFPLWNKAADPKDARNYFFDATDDYLRILRDQCGVTQIVYRLGASIEHSHPRRYFAKCPDDFARYAEICAGIVRHYTKAAWANGFDAGVTHWEIWNEPNNVPEMWDKDYDTFLRMYVTVARRLRQEFPDIRIGGPGNGGSAPDDRLERLVAACRKANVPLDFYSEHGYAGTPEAYGRRIVQCRRILDEAGLKSSEIHFNEWHYFPCKWSDLKDAKTARKMYLSPDGINGIAAAAHLVRALTLWQDVPVDMVNFYSTVGKGWGVYDAYGVKRPTYFALRQFGEFLCDVDVRVKAASSDGKVTVLAGRSKDGSRREILVSALKVKAGEPIRIKFGGGSLPAVVKVSALCGEEPTMCEVPLADGCLTLTSAGHSGTWRIAL